MLLFIKETDIKILFGVTYCDCIQIKRASLSVANGNRIRFKNEGLKKNSFATLALNAKHVAF